MADKDTEVFNAQLLEGAVKFMASQIDADRVEKWIAATLSDAMKFFDSYHFQEQLKARVMPVFVAVMDKPTFQAKVQEAVESVAEKLLGKMTTEIEATLVKAVQEAIKDKIHPERKRDRY